MDIFDLIFKEGKADLSLGESNGLFVARAHFGKGRSHGTLNSAVSQRIG